VDIPCTGGKGSDLHFDAVLQEYLPFPLGKFLLVLFLLGVDVVNFALQTTPDEKTTRIKIG
jgi:hypothetical protein